MSEEHDADHTSASPDGAVNTAEVSRRVQIDVHIDPDAPRKELEQLLAGLQSSPPRVSARYFYDARGSELFEQITELDSYYQTRTERQLLHDYATEIVEVTGATELIELGSGSASKTRVLLDAMQRSSKLQRYVPLDVSESMIRRTAEELTREYPGLVVHGIVGNFLEHLGELPEGEKSLALFLGGTIGNLRPDNEAVEFLTNLGNELGSGSWLLLGTDLIKDERLLHLAYNDPEGVTAEFNLNLLSVLNRRFGANFDPAEWEHRAVWQSFDERIEMHLVAKRPTRVRVEAIDFEREWRAGEMLLTEISTKFSRSKVERLLDRSCFELQRWFTDERRLFGLSLARCAG